MFVGELLTIIDILAQSTLLVFKTKSFLLNLEVLDNEMLKPIYMLMFNLSSKLLFPDIFREQASG